MRSITRKLLVFALLSVLTLTAAVGQTYKVAIPQLSASSIVEALIKALGEEEGVTMEIQTVPAARALYLLENGQVDILVPKSVITDAAKLAEQNFDYATPVLSRSAYVLYTNKSKNIDPAELKKGNPKGYKIETNTANVDSFEFKALPSSNIEASLKKVDSGVIDGYLYSQISSDAALKGLGLKTIKRQLYNFSELGFGIKKGGVNGVVDKLLVNGMKRLRANGKFDKIMGDLIKQGEYDEWQP